MKKYFYKKLGVVACFLWGCSPSMVWASPEPVDNETLLVSASMNHLEHLSSVRMQKLKSLRMAPDVPALFEKDDKNSAVQRDNAPVYRQNVDTVEFELPKELSMFHVKAALKIQNRIKQRNMRLVDYRFSDVNGDSKPDVIVLSEVEAHQNKKLMFLGVYELDAELNPVLRYERKQGVEKHLSDKSYIQSIETRENGFQFCEDWQIASWSVHECHDIAMNKQWEPNVLRYEIMTSEPKAHSSQSNVFDFGTALGGRAYDRLPDGPFMPPLHREAAYSMIFAGYDASLPSAPVAINPSQSSDFLNDSGHAPIEYSVRWNERGLYLSIEMNDSDLMAKESCSDLMSVQLADHVELWFDLSPVLAVRSEHPQSWMLEYEKNYQNEPYRHSLDSDVYGLAVTAEGCVVPMTPTRENWQVIPEVSAEKTPNGYGVNVFIPSAFYGKASMHELDRAQGLGVTIRQHDVHEHARYESIATSTWQWPDPFTFGQIWLLPLSGTFPPPFPLQWNSWLVDNE